MKKKWAALIVLGMAQFLMVLDTSVMNVSISQLVTDFDTDVIQIQTAITFYALVMAAFMITGGKLADVWGRRRTFTAGMIVYAAGSALTAASWSVPMLTLGWSVLEGIGAALVLPAMVALIADNYKGKDRAAAFGLIGGLAGAAVAIGPILGGWVTTNLSWRFVFVGEVGIVIVILVAIGLITSVKPERRPKIDWLGVILSGLGLALIVYGTLQSSQWGIIGPKNSPVEPFGLALTPFVIGIGMIILYLFIWWEKRQEKTKKREPLIHISLFKNKSLRGGLVMILAQNIILAGVFFAIPLYLQLTLGLDAFETGIRMLPVSVTLLITSIGASQMVLKFSPRRIMQMSLVILLIAIGVLLTTIEPILDELSFGIAMALLGIGIGLMAAILGNMVQSSVVEKDRSEVGGLQNTATQLGIALGTAVIGAIIISGLASSFLSQIADDDRISIEIEQAVEIELTKGVSFIPAGQVQDAVGKTNLKPDVAMAVVENYSESQLDALRLALLATGMIVVAALFITRKLPSESLGKMMES